MSSQYVRSSWCRNRDSDGGRVSRRTPTSAGRRKDPRPRSRVGVSEQLKAEPVATWLKTPADGTDSLRATQANETDPSRSRVEDQHKGLPGVRLKPVGTPRRRQWPRSAVAAESARQRDACAGILRSPDGARCDCDKRHDSYDKCQPRKMHERRIGLSCRFGAPCGLPTSQIGPANVRLLLAEARFQAPSAPFASRGRRSLPALPDAGLPLDPDGETGSMPEGSA